MALQEGEVLMGLTFDYGQRAAFREVEASRKVCGHFSLPHRVMMLPWMGETASSSLIPGKGESPLLKEEDLSDAGITKKTAHSVWVPNRNGVFVNIAAAVGESMGVGLIVTGFNLEEAATFPDNSKEFLNAANASLAYSTLNKVRVISYTSEMGKKEIVRAGLRYNVPMHTVWSCYLGEEKMCGECESCRRLKRAISGTEAEGMMRACFF
jgi:7-cyano-7-deazaguanine synthase